MAPARPACSTSLAEPDGSGCQSEHAVAVAYAVDLGDPAADDCERHDRHGTSVAGGDHSREPVDQYGVEVGAPARPGLLGDGLGTPIDRGRSAWAVIDAEDDVGIEKLE